MNTMTDQTFFGYQLALRCAGNDEVRRTLLDLVRAARASQSLNEKGQLHHHVAQLLGALVDRCDFAHWDLIRGADGASEWQQWIGEVEAIDEEGESGSVPTELGQSGYQLITVLFALDASGDADEVAGTRCDIAESEYFTRDTLRAIVATGGLLPFSSVRSDAIYLVPGTLERSVPHAVLCGEGYEYLHELK